CFEKQFNQERCDDHGDIKDADDEASDFPAIILAVDVDDGQHEQVSVNERDDATEADAAVPKHCSQRNIAYGTNKRNDSDDRPDNWSPNLCGDWMRDQEETVPEIRRHPRSQCPCDQQSDSDIFPYCSQIHYEVVTRCGKPIRGCEALPERALRHAHVHFGVTFHLAPESPLRLCARFSNEFARQESSEQQRDEYDHQWATQEFSGRKLPAHEDNDDDCQLSDQVR